MAGEVETREPSPFPAVREVHGCRLLNIRYAISASRVVAAPPMLHLLDGFAGRQSSDFAPALGEGGDLSHFAPTRQHAVRRRRSRERVLCQTGLPGRERG